MYRARSTSLPLALRLFVLAAVAVLYLALRQHIFTIDSLYYLWDAEFAAGRDLLHPHHLALEPLLRAWWRLWQWFGWPGRAVTPLQILNIALSLAALVACWRLLATLIRDRLAAGLWWLLLAVSYQPWYHATQAEGLPMYAMVATLNLWWAASLPGRDRPPTVRTAAAVAATMTAGVLVHQSLVLWTPLLAWMLGREAPQGRRWRYGAGTLAAAGLAVLLAYVLAGAWTTGSLAPGDLWRWFTGYSQEFSGRCGSLHFLFSTDVPRGLASALLTGNPLKAYVFGGRPADAALVAALVPYALLGLLLAVGLLRLPAALGRCDPVARRAVLNLIPLILVGALFAGWWEPANRKFWAPVVPGLLALAAVGWSGWPARRPHVQLVAAAAVTAVVLCFNLWGGILPRHREHDARQPLLMFLARSVRPADAVVLQEDRVWQCAIYFRPQRIVHGLPGPNSDRDDPEHTVLQAAVDDAVRTLTAGGVLYVSASGWPAFEPHLEAALGEVPAPVEIFRFGDADLQEDEQVLLAVRLPVG